MSMRCKGRVFKDTGQGANFMVVLATIIFALDRMDVISEGVALFINVSLMALYWCIASILNKDPK